MLRAFAGRGRPRVRYNGNVNLVFDGNSLMWGSSLGSSSPNNLPNRIANMAPVLNSGASVYNSAFSSGQWTGGPYPMGGGDYGGGQTDARWIAGKTNILICWETTNQVYLGSGTSAAANAAAMKTYLDARRALHPWIMVYISTIPREKIEGNIASRADGNAQLVAADQHVRDNMASLGVDHYVDLRQAGSPFAFTGYTTGDFDACASLWQADETVGNRVHLSAAGYAVVADYVADELPLLIRRPH